MNDVFKNEKVLAALTYLLGPINLIGPIVSILFLLLEKKNQYIRFHAMQSTITFGGIYLLEIILQIVPYVNRFVIFLLFPAFSVLTFMLWLFLMWKAYTGEKYKLPYIGELAERQLEKLK